MDMDNNTESGIDTSPDMNSSTVDFSSPERITTTTKLTPRALVYDDMDGDEMPSMIRRRTINAFAKNNNNNDDGDKPSLEDDEEMRNPIRPLRQSTLMQSKMHLESPPYRKVPALRLFDTPATPKTIIEKSSVENRSTASTPANMFNKFLRKSILSTSNVPRMPNVHDRRKAFPSNKTFEPMTANINPFSPNFLHSKKRSRTDEICRSTRNNIESLTNKSNASINSMDEDSSGENTGTGDEWQAPKRLALHNSNIPRYEKEFLEMSLIGEGVLHTPKCSTLCVQCISLLPFVAASLLSRRCLLRLIFMSFTTPSRLLGALEPETCVCYFAQQSFNEHS